MSITYKTVWCRIREDVVYYVGNSGSSLVIWISWMWCLEEWRPSKLVQFWQQTV